MSFAKKLSNRRVRTGEVRLSYAHLLAPRPKEEEDDTEKYSVSIIIPKSDVETVQILQEAVEAAKQEGAGTWGGKIPARLKLCLRDGDTDRPDDPAYQNAWFVNANSKAKPQILKLAGGKLVPTDSPDDVYSGVYASVTIEMFAYAHKTSKGVGAGLGNILIVRDGEPLAGGADAEDDFGDLGESAVAELDPWASAPSSPPADSGMGFLD